MAPPKTSFAVVRKKTPFQKAKAEEELKRKRHAEEAAKLYDDFAASFEADKRPRGINFVSAGTQASGSHPGEDVFDDGRRERYVPPIAPPGVTEASEATARTSETPSTSARIGSGSMKPSGSGSGAKPRAIDALLGEMIAKQQERERARRDGRDIDASDLGRSRGDADGTTTNLFVGNLPRDVDEDVVKKAFAVYGPIGSVKIFWPRENEDVRLRTQLSGFVAFMTRSSAERAKEEMDGAMLGSHDLRVSWGKAVPLPAKAIWPLATEEEIRPGEGNFSAAQRLRSSMRPVIGDPARLEPQASTSPGALDVIVRYPEDHRITALIDILARYVAEDGSIPTKSP